MYWQTCVALRETNAPQATNAAFKAEVVRLVVFLLLLLLHTQHSSSIVIKEKKLVLLMMTIIDIDIVYYAL